LQVYPTQSVFRFGARGVELTVTFTTPLLTDDVEVMSRPVTYLSFSVRAPYFATHALACVRGELTHCHVQVRSTDGAAHHVELYYDNTAEWCVNTVDQFVEWKRFNSTATSASNFERLALVR
jgi:hypothetical protein